MKDAELTIVIPLFNEAKTIAKVIGDWHAEADRLGIRHIIHIYDDASTDGSWNLLENLAPSSPWLRITRRPHSGHGPAIRQGYAEADTPWIFQVDSDDEIDTRVFSEFWKRRDDFDLLIGYRATPRESRVRHAVAWCARQAVRLCFGKTARDVNCPYRLLRRDALQAQMHRIPDTAFAPNVLICGLAARAGWRIFEAPVVCHFSRHRPSYLRHLRLLRAARQAFLDVVRVALHGGAGKA